MTILIICTILALLLFLTGFVGCVVPVLPGPVIAYCGLLAMIPSRAAPSGLMLALTALGTILITLLDYVIPAIGANRFHCSKWGTWGCFVGSLIGLLFSAIWGAVVGAFLGAFIGELIARKEFQQAAIGATGAFVGFLSGVFIKIIWCACMFFYFVCLLVKVVLT